MEGRDELCGRSSHSTVIGRIENDENSADLKDKSVYYMVCSQSFPHQNPKYERTARNNLLGFVSANVGLRLLCVKKTSLKVTPKAVDVWLAVSENIRQAIL